MLSFAQLAKNIAHELMAMGVETAEASREAEIIMEYATGLSLSKQLANANKLVSEDVLAKIDVILKRRFKREPLQYCLAEAFFMGLRFAVSPGIFIPRSDTECLVELVLKRLSGVSHPCVGELGIGSGAIAISILHNRQDACVYAVDISSAACQLSWQNAIAHGVHSRLFLSCGDWCAWRSQLRAKLDVFVANPPYIALSEAPSLAPEVALWEPEAALYGSDPDGLGFYRQMSLLVPGCLKTRGFLAVEIGDKQGQVVCEIFQSAGWQEVSVHLDIHQLPRVVTAICPN